MHLRPTPAFEPPAAENYDHLALVVDEPIADVKARLRAAGIEITKAAAGPLGATGEAPAGQASG